jgi:hypothetical protein
MLSNPKKIVSILSNIVSKYMSGNIPYSGGPIPSVGYSTFEDWSPLAEIKELETVERGNPWFDDSNINIDEYWAKWVTFDPKDAIAYAYSPEFKDIDTTQIFTEDDFSDVEEYEEYLKFVDEIENYKTSESIFLIPTEGSQAVLDDGDGGYLLIKRVR